MWEQQDRIGQQGDVVAIRTRERNKARVGQQGRIGQQGGVGTQGKGRATGWRGDTGRGKPRPYITWALQANPSYDMGDHGGRPGPLYWHLTKTWGNL